MEENITLQICQKLCTVGICEFTFSGRIPYRNSKFTISKTTRKFTPKYSVMDHLPFAVRTPVCRSLRTGSRTSEHGHQWSRRRRLDSCMGSIPAAGRRAASPGRIGSEKIWNTSHEQHFQPSLIDSNHSPFEERSGTSSTRGTSEPLVPWQPACSKRTWQCVRTCSASRRTNCGHLLS